MSFYRTLCIVLSLIAVVGVAAAFIPPRPKTAGVCSGERAVGSSALLPLAVGVATYLAVRR